MSYIQNIQIQNETIQFDINNTSNKILVPFVNALRRTILTDISTWCIEEKSVQLLENTSVFDNEFVAHRLSLIPIRSSLDIEYDELHIRCSKKNDVEEEIGVYVRDFEITDENGNIVNPDTLFPYLNILLLKLSYQQSISFECTLVKNSVYEGGSSIHCPVCTCIHQFGVDEKQIEEKTKEMTPEEKRSFMMNDAQRVVQYNSRGDPAIYHMTVESIQQYEVREIVQMGFELLKERLQKFRRDLETKNERIEVREGSVFEDILEILVKNETDTLGNLVSAYMGIREEVYYSGYVIPHPLKREVLFKIKLQEKNDVDTIFQLYANVVGEIIELMEDVKKEF